MGNCCGGLIHGGRSNNSRSSSTESLTRQQQPNPVQGREDGELRQRHVAANQNPGNAAGDDAASPDYARHNAYMNELFTRAQARAQAAMRRIEAERSDPQSEVERMERENRVLYVLAQLPTYLHRGGDKPVECAICMADFADMDVLRHLPCMHVFHAECVDEWLLRSARTFVCPSCSCSVDATLMASLE